MRAWAKTRCVSANSEDKKEINYGSNGKKNLNIK